MTILVSGATGFLGGHRLVAARFAPRPGFVDRLDFFLAERTFDVGRARRGLGPQ